MARIRTIKPQHCTDKNLPKISLQAHLLWVLSWCFSDDKGVLENDLLLLKSQLFPRRTDIKIEQMQVWMDQLVKANYIIPFSFDGIDYYLQRTFSLHQKIDRPQPSIIPEAIIRRTLDEYSMTQQPCIVLDSIVKESKGEYELKPIVLTESEIRYNAFLDWCKVSAPQVLKMKEPITIEQYEKLITDYPEQSLKEVLTDMHNKVDLLKKYTSANLTLRNWIKSRVIRPVTITGQPAASANVTSEIMKNLFIKQSAAKA